MRGECLVSSKFQNGGLLVLLIIIWKLFFHENIQLIKKNMDQKDEKGKLQFKESLIREFSSSKDIKVVNCEGIGLFWLL